LSATLCLGCDAQRSENQVKSVHTVVCKIPRLVLRKPMPATVTSNSIKGTFGCQTEPPVIVDVDGYFAILRKADTPLLGTLPSTSHKAASERPRYE